MSVDTFKRNTLKRQHPQAPAPSSVATSAARNCCTIQNMLIRAIGSGVLVKESPYYEHLRIFEA
jgi:hypothetical protein